MSTIKVTNIKLLDNLTNRIATIRADLKTIIRGSEGKAEANEAAIADSYLEQYHIIFEQRYNIECTFSILDFAELLKSLETLEAAHRNHPLLR